MPALASLNPLVRLAHAAKAFRLTWGRQSYSYYGGGSLWGWPRFDNLQDPWPRHGHSGVPGSSVDYQALAGDLKRNSVVSACVGWMGRTFPEPRLRVMRRSGDGDSEEVKDHPLVRLLDRPNPHFSGDRLWQVTLQDYVTTGNAYWVKQRSRSGKVAEVWYRPEAMIEPEWDEAGREYITGYAYKVDGKRVPVPLEDVIHFRFGVHPDNERLGWSPLLAGVREVASLNAGATYRAALYRNGGRPAYALVPQDKDAAEDIAGPDGESIARRLKELWNQLYNTDTAGGLFVPTFAAKLEKVGFSPEEMDIVHMLEWDTDMVCALLGLNSMVVGLPAGEKGRTYANMGEALRDAYQGNIKPTQKLFAEDLGVYLLREFSTDESEYVDWDYSRVDAFKDEEKARWERALAGLEKKLLTRNEARAIVGYKELTPEQEEEFMPVAPPPAESRGDQQAQNGRTPPFGREAGMNGKTFPVEIWDEDEGAALVLTAKHLPGRHDQRRHGRHRGGTQVAARSSVHAAGVEDSMEMPEAERQRLVEKYNTGILAEDRAEIDAAVTAWQQKRDTKGLHTDAKGNYTEARKEKHAEIFDREEYFGGDRGKVAPGEQPEVIVLAGAPASGKGSTFKGEYDEQKYIVLNADDFKEHLPEYKGTNAALVHEESSYLMNRALATARAERRNIIIDGTLANERKWGEIIGDMKSEGYKTAGFHVGIPLEANLQRAMGRYHNKKRYVPLEMIATDYNKYQGAFPALAGRGLFDRWAKFDNGGSSPVKIAEGKGAG